MDEKYRKPLFIAAGTLFLIVALIVFTDIGHKLGKFFTIAGNITSNVLNASHGDNRDLKEIDAEFIKTRTGSTVEIDERELPKALRPMKEHKHPPFSMGSCQVCHAPKRSKPAAILTKTVWGLCYKCHEPEKTAALDCNKCHNPHHSDRDELLREKVIEDECPVGDFKE